MRRSEARYHPLIWTLNSLLTVRSSVEYSTLCKLLMEGSNPSTCSNPVANAFKESIPLDIQRWAQHKAHSVIAAGLNKHCSEMDPKDWDSLSKNSNAVEQAAKKSYSYGKNLQLLQAVLMYVIALGL